MTTQTNENAAQGDPSASADDDPKGMRKIISEQADTIRELRADKRDGILTDIGLTPETGLGKAMAEAFDRGDVNLETLASTAVEQYGHVITDPQVTHPQAELIQQQQGRLDAASQQAGSVAVPTKDATLAEAEANQDYDATMAMKGQEVAGWFNRPPGT